MNSATGKWIMFAGIVIFLFGVIIYFFHGRLNWIGRLPGDIRIERENFRFYVPVTTMVLLSVLLSLVVWVVRRLL